ncbi:MAG: hypothetical protein RR428_00710 [Coprobacillus sp.]
MIDDDKVELAKKAKIGVDPISFCGHHCTYCFLTETCGGCRSSLNCCSFATLFEDNICPNVKCSTERKIDGCYDCIELMNCTIGYYGRKNEYIAKATAIFIHKYGKDVYTRTLSKAITDGNNYPKTFDETGSVEKSVQLLEKYL